MSYPPPQSYYPGMPPMGMPPGAMPNRPMYGVPPPAGYPMAYPPAGMVAPPAAVPTRPPMMQSQPQQQNQNTAAPASTPSPAPAPVSAPAPAPAPAPSSAPAVSSSPVTPYIGGLISLVSKMNIRYEGTLHSINAQEATVALKDVRNFGTENRVAGAGFVPADPTVYEFVIFSGKDISDLHVIERKTNPAPPSDPAILSAKAAPAAAPAPAPVSEDESRHHQVPNQRQHRPHRDDKAEFDFASANARFEKVKKPENKDEDVDPEHEVPEESDQPSITVKYDKKKSFFDDLETGNSRLPPRHVQRKQDVDTFGDIAMQHNRSGGRGGGGGYGNQGNRGYNNGGNRNYNQNQNRGDRDNYGGGGGGYNRGPRRGGYNGNGGNGNWGNGNGNGNRNGGFRQGGNNWRQGGNGNNGNSDY